MWLELENDDNYINTGEEDRSGNRWSSEDSQSETPPTGWFANETAFHQDVEESVSEDDAICRRSPDEDEPSGNECALSHDGSKAEKRKVVEKRIPLLDSFSLWDWDY